MTVLYALTSAEWDDLMPFPVVDYKRYMKLGFSVGLYLVTLPIILVVLCL